MRLPISDHLHPISLSVSKLLQMQTLVKFALSTGGVSLFSTLVGVNHNLWTTKFVPKKLKTSLYRVVQNLFQYLEPFMCGSRVCRTDSQTDKQTD